MKKYAVGVDIGGSHLLSVAVDVLSGELIETTRVYQKIDSQGSKDEIFEAWATTINSSIEKLEKEQVAGVGLAMPGPFDYSKGIALFKGNEKYESIYGLQVEEFLRPLLALPDAVVRYHNDASCFGIGEDRYGSAKESQRSLGLTLGTGFGSVFVDEGVPIVVRKDVPEDGCLWHLPFKGGIADEYFSTRWFRNNYEYKTGVRLSGVKDLVELSSIDSDARSLFDQFGSNLAEFLIPWSERFKPQIIVLGGNISKAYPLFGKALSYGLQSTGIKIPIKLSELGEDAAVLGAARLLDDNYFAKIKSHLPTK